jgi:hypothetical protein
MAYANGPTIVRNGLVLSLDASDSTSFTSNELEVEYLIAAGGGGGAVHNTGGAGGGGVLLGKTTVIPQSYSVVVGSGGTWGNTNSLPTNGGNSSVFGNTAIGGGRGGQWTQFLPTDGGSGAGGNAFSDTSSPSHTTGKIGLQPTSTDGGFGNNGGNALVGPSDRAGGGGGGSDTSGYNASSNVPGNGGDGILLNISGVGTHYGGGGGGAHRFNSSISVGGNGGGGMGLSSGASKDGSQFGQVNTGGGAGGIETGTQTGTGGGNGGSGIVIIRYRGPQRAKGGTVTYNKGWTIHTFTGSGNFEVGQFWGDLSNNGNNGELVNGVIWSSDGGGSLSFSATDRRCIISNIDAAFTSNISNFTVSSWLKSDRSYTAHPIDFRNAAPGTSLAGVSGYTSWIRNSGDIVSSITDTNTNNSMLTLTSHAPIKGWVNVVSVKSDGTHLLYVDGIFRSHSSVGIFVDFSDVWLIGQRRDYAQGSFPGNISSVAYYNRALTADEVLQNYNATKGRYGL